MAPKNIPLRLPPGIVKNGTPYQARGRWIDSHLVRSYQGVLQPVGGWIGLTGTALTPREDQFPAANSLTAPGQNTEATTANAPSYNDKYDVHYKVTVVNNESTGPAKLTVALESFDGAAWNLKATREYQQSSPGTGAWTHEQVELTVPGQSSTEKVRLRAVSFDKPGVPATGDNFSASNLLDAVGETTEATTAEAPSTDDSYTVHYTATLTNNVGGVGSFSLTVVVEAWDGSTWTQVGSKTYTFPEIGSDTLTHETITVSVAGQSSTEKLRLRISAFSATDGSFSVHGFDGLGGDPSKGVTYNVPGDATFSVHGFNKPTDGDPAAGVTYSTSSGSLVSLTGVCRGAFASELSASRGVYLLLGTHSKIYHFQAATLTDVTPAAGFSAGQVSSTYSAGGSRLHGTVTEATTWSLDEVLTSAGAIRPVACSSSDGKIWEQTNPAAPVAMTQVTNSPTEVRFIFVTPEGFLFALGAASAPRRISWPDQNAHTVWTPAPTNQAGSYDLKGNGVPMCGAVGDGESLIWTDQDLFAAKYLGPPFVYGFTRRSTNCGIISRKAFARIGSGSFAWMGSRQFFAYDGGAVREIPSEVGDYVFSDLDASQAAKVWALSLAQFTEVWWFYPSISGGTGEVDRYVCWNWTDNAWYVGSLRRTAGVDAGALQHPVLVDSDGTNSTIYEHEKGSTRSGVAAAFIESGPVELGEGDQVMTVLEIIPDEKTLGALSVRLFGQFYPTDPETAHGPFTGANPIPVRVTARQVRLRLTEAVQTAWRAGEYRVAVAAGGRR